MRLGPSLRKIASGLMLLGTLGFVQQGAMISASQAAALAGAMLGLAIVVSGPIHVHGDLARNVHTHGGDHSPGHVHDVADTDQQESDGDGPTLLWSLNGSSAIMPVIGDHRISFDVVSASYAAPQDLRDGIEPDGLSRPPSTPSIA